MTEKTLAGRFLVATPSMKDPFFSKTVILLVGITLEPGLWAWCLTVSRR